MDTKMSFSNLIRLKHLQELHEATSVLRSTLATELGDLLPPYADEVLNDLQDMAANSDAAPRSIQKLFHEAAGVMEMLPSVPAQWLPLDRAARAAGLIAEPE